MQQGMHKSQDHLFRICEGSHGCSEVLYGSAQDVRLRIFRASLLSLMLVPMLLLFIIDWQGLVDQRTLGGYGINGIIAQTCVQRRLQANFGQVYLWSAMFAYDDISLTLRIDNSSGNIVGHRIRVMVPEELQSYSLRPIICVDDPLV